ncbi:acyl-CoA dehydrogenase family protein, partial [Microvirga pakistanensis]|uniref:acyl-CoA dehydrogenase family protein n=1 Tax=Microvirga pakistanensis TaxID=1682650 RepID=UPI002452F238
DVGARLLDQGEAVRFALEKAEDLTALCRLADTVGTMEEMLLLTVEHLNTRQQFGRALATFQVLQHRVAEMFTEL